MPPDLRDASAAYRRYLAAVVTYHQAAAARLGLGATDYQAHNLLALHGELATGDLARLLGLTPSATTRVVDRLVTLGAVDRRPDPADRRRTVVAATDAGLPGLADQLTDVRELVGSAFADLDETEVRTLVTYFERATTGFRDATERLGA